jgi:uncharacterized protein YqjF (DUF2071 family)
MVQRWHDLLFAHWPCDPAPIRRLIPRGLSLDLRDGVAWIGVVPFVVRGLRIRGLPPVPTAHAFPELNVRTYVTHGGKPGVWFFSLDAESRLAVFGARVGFSLPYFTATMSAARAGRSIVYTSERRGRRRARFGARYTPIGPVFNATDGSLEHFLTERYCLYAADRRHRLWRAEIHHAPWPLQIARAEIVRNTAAAAAGIRLPSDAPLLHFARRQDVRVWVPVRAEA